jgi:hypothetical protein
MKRYRLANHGNRSKCIIASFAIASSSLHRHLSDTEAIFSSSVFAASPTSESIQFNSIPKELSAGALAYSQLSGRESVHRAKLSDVFAELHK